MYCTCCQSLYQELLQTIPKEHESGVAEFNIVGETPYKIVLHILLTCCSALSLLDGWMVSYPCLMDGWCHIPSCWMDGAIFLPYGWLVPYPFLTFPKNPRGL